MKKYTCVIDFTYNVVPDESNFNIGIKFKRITSGLFNNLDDAINRANKIVKILDKKGLSIRNFVEFNKDNYVQTVSNAPFNKDITFYLSIETLNYENINNTLNEIQENVKKYKNIHEK